MRKKRGHKMKKGLSNDKVLEFENLMVRQLKRRYEDGLKIGTYVASSTVYEILSNTSKPIEQRVEEALDYCRIGKKYEKELEQNESQENKEE